MAVVLQDRNIKINPKLKKTCLPSFVFVRLLYHSKGHINVLQNGLLEQAIM
jgi:hypothetical protein